MKLHLIDITTAGYIFKYSIRAYDFSKFHTF